MRVTRSARTLLIALVVTTALLVGGTVMALSVGSGRDTAAFDNSAGRPPSDPANSLAYGAFGDPGDPTHWTPERMSQARARDPQVVESPGAPGPLPSTPPRSPGATPSPGGSDGPAGPLAPLPDAVAEAKPPVVNATPVARPYDTDAVTGKLFFDTPDGPSVCTGTVVADPRNPGRSNLVWTAGHCLHGGRGGGWFKNVQFVPAFNSGGHATLANLKDPGPVSPFGLWWAVDAATSQKWKDGGTGGASPASAFDYGVVRVRNPNGSPRSLEEVVGRAIPLWFDAPRELPQVWVYGYPQDAPFNGLTMFRCEQDPRRMTVDPNAPPLVRIGCTMTGGASGGAWYAKSPDGRFKLIANSALGGADHSWLAGPYLSADARAVLDTVKR
ncbi:trypsin-like serine peptidase [Yinghuangia seranimata]|uniref:trypsin-like serine peptidase n=1 Tax=Yinghuangia seranimata TaxID=408067 RepID=UPI00248D0890|nr:hypothetical protein [Yinghuangia seranimata]MDI2128637.1 hypothetical protein [Yinghuangia seranimata]